MAEASKVRATPLMASPVPEPVKVTPTQEQPVPVPAPAARAETPAYAAPERQAPQVVRIMARPLMGQTPPPAAAPQGITLSREEASLILQGLTETLKLADNARTTGWRCTGVDDATFYKGRVLRGRLADYLAQPVLSAGAFTITKEEADVADRILGCSNEATAATSNKTAWIALGVIVVGAAIFFSVTSSSR